jgi:hypothetical protein
VLVIKRLFAFGAKVASTGVDVYGKCLQCLELLDPGHCNVEQWLFNKSVWQKMGLWECQEVSYLQSIGTEDMHFEYTGTNHQRLGNLRDIDGSSAVLQSVQGQRKGK